MYFGEHLMLDGYEGDLDNLNNKDLVSDCLTGLSSKLGMTILGGPEIYYCEGNDKKDPGGWSGILAINESHISIHTFPKRGFVSIDVYSCKNGLDTDFISNYFKEKFQLKDLEINFIKRGTRYPQANIY